MICCNYCNYFIFAKFASFLLLKDPRGAASGLAHIHVVHLEAAKSTYRSLLCHKTTPLQHC